MGIHNSRRLQLEQATLTAFEFIKSRRFMWFFKRDGAFYLCEKNHLI